MNAELHHVSNDVAYSRSCLRQESTLLFELDARVTNFCQTRSHIHIRHNADSFGPKQKQRLVTYTLTQTITRPI